MIPLVKIADHPFDRVRPPPQEGDLFIKFGQFDDPLRNRNFFPPAVLDPASQLREGGVVAGASDLEAFKILDLQLKSRTVVLVLVEAPLAEPVQLVRDLVIQFPSLLFAQSFDP